MRVIFRIFVVNIVSWMCLCAFVSTGLANNKADFFQFVRSEHISTAQEAIEKIKSNDIESAMALAETLKNPNFSRFLMWSYMVYSDQSIDPTSLMAFIRENPDWPLVNKIKIKIEGALEGQESPEIVLSWFNHNPPLTLHGVKHYVKALLQSNQTKAAESVIVNAWTEMDMDVEQQKSFLEQFSSYLKPMDHTRRLQKLLWSNKIDQAKTMLNLVSQEENFAAQLRIRIQSAKKDSSKTLDLGDALKLIPNALRNDVGLMHDLIVYYRKLGQWQNAANVILSIPKNPEYQNALWDQHESVVRQYIVEKNYEQALRLLKNHPYTTDRAHSEAEFLLGWLYMQNPISYAQAFQHFKNVFEYNLDPIHQGKGAFWAGRAAEKMENMDECRYWYAIAAKYPVTFYGQLAISKLGSSKHSIVPKDEIITSKELKHYYNQPLAQIVAIAHRLNARDTANVFYNAIASKAKSEKDFAFLMHLAHDIGRPELAVHYARKAFMEHHIILRQGYPTAKHVPSIKMPDVEMDEALVYALIRKESSFDRHAISRSGAMGLMQLMPPTAEEVAKKKGVAFSKDALLKNPKYNIELGTHYLNKQVDAFDGSYPLALAAYNAGPTTTRNWLKSLGDPRIPNSAGIDMIDWIEMIPIRETRNYIHRVVESAQVYRHILDEKNDVSSIRGLH